MDHPANLMQVHLRRNNEELQDYLKGLDSWEEEMKEKDQGLVKKKSILKENLPPVRGVGLVSAKAGERQRKKKRRDGERKANGAGAAKASRIRSSDYRSWDQFDVDKACEEIDYNVQSSSSSDEEEEAGEALQESEEGSSEDEEVERQRRAVAEKEKGNALYQEGEYERAVECYSRGMMLDPLSAALPANRALAQMKLEKYAAVEEDCSTALAIDENYVKAYLRRGVARRHLGKCSAAIQDFERVLRLEPAHKQGSSELKKTQQLLKVTEREALVAQGHVLPVKRPADLRSKRPLRRILIEDISVQVETSSRDTPSASASDSASAPPDSHSLHNIVARESDVKIEDHKEADASSALPSEGDCGNCQSSESGSCSMDVTESSTVERGNNESDAAVLSKTSNGIGARQPAQEVSPPTEECPALPPLPETTFEFQSHWKQLRKNRSQLVAYFKRLSPPSYPMLLQQSLETDIFSDIISILKEDYVGCKLRCIDELTWLTRVARLSVAVMFLSRKDKDNLKSVFVELLALCSSECDIGTVKKLTTEFSVKL